MLPKGGEGTFGYAASATSTKPNKATCSAATVHASGRPAWTGPSHYGIPRTQGEPVDERAYELLREVLGDKHPDTIYSMAELATTYHEQGRYSEAEAKYTEVLALRREVLGDKHPDTIHSMASLAATYPMQGRYSEAEKPHTEVLALRRELLGV
jgi:cytochrome c-type biogenesis protein CcmH/NrfG